MGSIPGQDTYPGCGFDHLSGYIQEATDQYFSLSFFLTLPLALKSVNLSLGEEFFKKRSMEEGTVILNRVTKENSQISVHWSEELEEVREEVMGTLGGGDEHLPRSKQQMEKP